VEQILAEQVATGDRLLLVLSKDTIGRVNWLSAGVEAESERQQQSLMRAIWSRRDRLRQWRHVRCIKMIFNYQNIAT
jgi:hypothetical protein